MNKSSVARLRYLLGRACDKLREFRDDRRGGVAVFIGAAIVPLVGALGLATDAAQGYTVKGRLAQAVDAAALAGGRVMAGGTTQAQANATADATMFFNANFPAGFMNSSVTGLSVTFPATGTIQVDATATVHTTFMRVLGWRDITVSASSQAAHDIRGLDVVLSMDISGSMNDGGKIGAAKQAAHDLVNILFAGQANSPVVHHEGQQYNVLNVGMVPWNHKVNVTIDNQPFVSRQSVATGQSFVNPVTGASQNIVWYANNSPVPLLSDPLPAGETTWRGCVYARFVGNDGNKANDADLSREPITLGGKQWFGWEPITNRQGEPQSGNWTLAEGGATWLGRPRQCYESYWNTQQYSSLTKPPAVPNRPRNVNNVQVQFNPVHNFAMGSEECEPCSTVGITPLTPQRSVIDNAINRLSATGNTNIPQGLYWAWEVLMPGAPFSEARPDPVPYPRQRAIVLMTDGQNYGGVGDAYKMWFGLAQYAGEAWFRGDMPAPPAPRAQGADPETGAPTFNNTHYDNLNNRLLQLATNIKADGVRIYVVQFALADQDMSTLLSQVATESGEPYYHNAVSNAALRAAFQAIAADLSGLRLAR